MYYAMHVSAPNCNSGNPRRCWVVFRKKAQKCHYSRVVGVWDEGYRGSNCMPKSMLDRLVHVDAIHINVAYKEYRAWLKCLDSQDIDAQGFVKGEAP